MFEREQAFPDLSFASEENAAYVQFRIAHCYETDRDLLLSCVLIEYKDPEDEPVHEFKFQFVVVCNDETQESFSTMERDIAASLIPPEMRSEIMDLVLQGLDILLRIVDPKRIFRVTKGRKLPDKALVKHHLITQRLKERGYSIYAEGIDQFGRNYWDMFAY